MKKYLKVELGSRGEVDGVEVVVGNLETFRKDLEVFKEGFDGEYLEYLEEFADLNGRFGNDDDDVLVEGRWEEECYYYIEYDKYVDDCKELIRLFEEGNVEEFCDLMDKFW
jgi:hypothetical protein